MPMKTTRRTLLKTMGTAAVVALPRASAGSSQDMRSPRAEGRDTPKIALEMGLGVSPQGMGQEEAAAAAARRIRQLGVTHVLGDGPRIQCTDAQLKELMDRAQKNG